MQVERDAKVKNNLSRSDILSELEGTVYITLKGSELFKRYKEGLHFNAEGNDGSDVELDWGFLLEQIDESWKKHPKRLRKM